MENRLRLKDRKAFSLSGLARCRWNILDFIELIGRSSIPTYLFCDIDMTWAEKLRAELRKHGHRTTVTAILLKAIAIAQLDHPATRTFRLPFGLTGTLNEIVAGFTVEREVDGQPAVFLGLIRDPHTKSLEQIARELKDYGDAELTTVPQLEVEHRFSNMPWLIRRLIWLVGMHWVPLRLRYLGATFGVSSLGKFGMKAIIPPCVTTSTFGVGAVEDRAVVRGGEVVVRPMTTLTLNFDHRLIDGAPAARFLSDVRSLLEGGLSRFLGDELAAAVPIEVGRESVPGIFDGAGNAVLVG